MGTKYSSNAASGYNATPPADDGTVSEANKVKWSTIKTKLADPVKDLADTINTELATHFNNGPIAVTSNTTLGATHYNQVIQVSGSGVTLTFTDANTLGAGWYCDIVSTDSTNSVTLARATASDMINESSADVTILPLQALHVVVNAAANGFLVDLKPRHSKTFQAANTMTLSGAVTMSGTNTLSGPTTISGDITLSGVIQGATPLVFEGATANDFETSIAITDPTADRTLTLPDASGTVLLQSAGQVLQVVSTAKTDTFTTTSTTFTDVTGLSASITPASTSNKVLVIVSFTGAATAGTNGFMGVLLRGATEIAIGDAAASREQATLSLYNATTANAEMAHICFLDSPSTTSATTYKLQVKCSAAGTIYIGRSQDDTDSAGYGRFPSTITLMEIRG